MKIKQLIALALLSVTLVACKTTLKDVTYFQDLKVNTPVRIDSVKDITFQPDDKLTIVVSCKEPELAALFNLVRAQNRLGNNVKGSSSMNNNGEISAYTVDSEGNIDFPYLGAIQVADKTKQQVAADIKRRLVDSGQISNPVVTVEFANLSYSILGEVKSAGRYAITRNKMTLLDAISEAGDLNITGKRDSIFVIREEGGVRTTYAVDIRSREFFDSPVYYVKQNDVIYVRPNQMRANQSTLNDNTFGSVGFWMSLGSFLMSLGVLVFK